VRLIADGGMGDVYEAVHEPTKRPVAVKCMREKHKDDDEVARRMRLEARGLSILNHPNIVAMLDAGVEQGMPWIAMELLRGKTLREYLHALGLLPIEAALYVGYEIADGIDAALEHHIVHRDLKPENVWVDEEGRIKLLDFGAAKFYGLEPRLTTDRAHALGTPYYMSPEQLLGEPVDGRTDIYALGVILYELFTGSHMFTRDGVVPSLGHVGQMHLHGAPRPLTEIRRGFPEDIWATLAKALAKNPDDRYAKISEMARDLRASMRRLRGGELLSRSPLVDARGSIVQGGAVGLATTEMAPGLVPNGFGSPAEAAAPFMRALFAYPIAAAERPGRSRVNGSASAPAIASAVEAPADLRPPRSDAPKPPEEVAPWYERPPELGTLVRIGVGFGFVVATALLAIGWWSRGPSAGSGVRASAPVCPPSAPVPCAVSSGSRTAAPEPSVHDGGSPGRPAPAVVPPASGAARGESSAPAAMGRPRARPTRPPTAPKKSVTPPKPKLTPKLGPIFD
jgi:serine/threonine-protein kinase